MYTLFNKAKILNKNSLPYLLPPKIIKDYMVLVVKWFKNMKALFICAFICVDIVNDGPM